MVKKLDKEAVNESMMLLVHAYALEKGLELDNYESVDLLYANIGLDLEINIPVMLGVESTSDLMEKLQEIEQGY